MKKQEPGFAGAWQTLVRTGLDPTCSGNATLTPSNYVPGGDDVALPEPSAFDMTLLDRLPELKTLGPQADLLLRETLGRGGMGEVRGAHQPSLNRDVAVKRLHDVRPMTIKALLREARLLGRLGHPNIVSVHALACDEEGAPMLVMKRVEGRRWDELMRSRGEAETTPLERHLTILRDVCKAVQFAHAQGVVHRDIKPGNVLVGEFGEVVLVDWGIAARIDEASKGMALGTPAYMAPEMVRGEGVSPLNDVYLLGSTLHRVLTGRPRHAGGNVEELLAAAHASEPAAYDASIPADLGRIANRATARNPSERYASVAEFVQALDQYEAHQSSRQLAATAETQAADFAARCDRHEDPALGELGQQARFAFVQALEAWPENTAARQGLVAHLARHIPVTLAAGHAHDAAVLVDLYVRWGGTDRALVDRVAAAVRREEALARLGKQMDLSVSAGWRMAYLGFYTGSALGAGGLAVVSIRMGWVPLDHRIGFAASAAAALMLSSLAVIGRGKLKTIANKRLVWTLILTGWMVFIHRAMAYYLDVPLEVTMTFDILLLALASALAALMLNLRLFAVTVLLLALVLGSVLVPALSLEIATFSLGAVGLVLMAVFAPWLRHRSR
ncbi:MAG: serine/threonine protein kinase [Proteobacteria bacterium]|nr:serine/threonine protein kinase [Pseudomonadota bacterium]